MDDKKIDECPICGGFLEDVSPYFGTDAWVECQQCGYIPQRDA